MGPFLNRDRFSAFVELLLPLVLVEAFRRDHDWMLYVIAAATMYASVVAGASRAGLIGVTLELFIVVLLAMRQGALSRHRLQTVAVVVIAGVLATAVGWQHVAARLTMSNPLAGRREFLISSLRMWRERPWMGFGLGAWPSVYPRFAIFDPGRFANHAHNDWAEWACDGGIPFVLGWLLIAWRTAVRALQSPEALGVTVVFVHSLLDFNFQNYPIFILVAVLIAAAESSVYQQAFDSRRLPQSAAIAR